MLFMCSVSVPVCWYCDLFGLVSICCACQVVSFDVSFAGCLYLVTLRCLLFGVHCCLCGLIGWFCSFVICVF